MMERLHNWIRREIARQIAVAIAEPRMAIITGYDPATHTLKALVMPEAAFPDQSGDVVETNFSPIATLSSGGSGIYVGRGPNDQVLIVHHEHDGGAPVIIGRVHTTSDAPPNVPTGEVWELGPKGSSIKFTADGKITAADSSSATITLMNNGTIGITATTLAIDANVQVTGSITATGSITPNV